MSKGSGIVDADISALTSAIMMQHSSNDTASAMIYAVVSYLGALVDEGKIPAPREVIPNLIDLVKEIAELDSKLKEEMN